MRGYLQRLALSVIKPDQKIRPIQTPVFLRPKDEGDTELPRPAETHPSPAGETAPVAEIHVSPPVANPPTISYPPERDADAPEILAPRPGVAEPKPERAELPKDFPPRLPSVRQAGEQTEILMSATPAAPAQANENRQMAGVGNKRKDQPSQAGKTIRREPSYVPLVAPRLPTPGSSESSLNVPSALPQAPLTIPIENAPGHPAAPLPYRPLLPAEASHQPSVPAALGLKKKPLHAGGPRRTEPPAREPDEIQIHIGRIEVIAVPPPKAQPAPAKPPRTGPSLEEYLRRRDRRSL